MGKKRDYIIEEEETLELQRKDVRGGCGQVKKNNLMPARLQRAGMPRRRQPQD